MQRKKCTCMSGCMSGCLFVPLEPANPFTKFIRLKSGYIRIHFFVHWPVDNVLFNNWPVSIPGVVHELIILTTVKELECWFYGVSEYMSCIWCTLSKRQQKRQRGTSTGTSLYGDPSASLIYWFKTVAVSVCHRWSWRYKSGSWGHWQILGGIKGIKWSSISSFRTCVGVWILYVK